MHPLVNGILLIAVGIFIITFYGLPVGRYLMWTFVEVPAIFAYIGGGILIVVGILGIAGVTFKSTVMGRVIVIGWIVFMGIGVLVQHLMPALKRKSDYRQED